MTSEGMPLNYFYISIMIYLILTFLSLYQPDKEKLPPVPTQVPVIAKFDKGGNLLVHVDGTKKDVPEDAKIQVWLFDQNTIDQETEAWGPCAFLQQQEVSQN